MQIVHLGLGALVASSVVGFASDAPSALRSSHDWPDLSGRWAQLQVTTSIVVLPIGGPAESRLETLVLVDVEQEGQQLVLTETVCSVHSEGPTSLVETSYPDAFVEALSGRTREARLDFESGRYTYREPKTYRTTGVELDDPAEESLPDAPDDPRVRDPDGDGHPGLTVEVRGFVNGQVFMVQKGWSELDGVVRSPRQIEGTVRWSSSQSVVAATHRFLTHPPVSKPHPSGDRHFFRMARVPREASCREVQDRAHRIFGL